MKTRVALFPLLAIACSPVVTEPVPAGRTIKVRLADRSPALSPKESFEVARDLKLTRAQLVADANQHLRPAPPAKVTVDKLTVNIARVEVETPPLPRLDDLLEEPVDASTGGADDCGALASVENPGRPCAARL